jgi:hypothetical protein
MLARIHRKFLNLNQSLIRSFRSIDRPKIRDFLTCHMQEAALKAHGIIWGIAGATICTTASVEPVNSIWGNMNSKIVSFDTHLLSVDSRSMIQFSAVTAIQFFE